MLFNSNKVRTVSKTIGRLVAACLVMALVAGQEKAGEQKKELPMFEAGPDGKAEIFNGKDLSGWDKDADFWSVENGEIVGKAGPKHPYSYLTTNKQVADFRLIVEVKHVPNAENSGIQFRSARVGKNEMKGMQADIGKGWWGKVYEEHQRGLLTKESRDQFVKPDDWNTYEIIAIGSKVRTAINGNLCVDLDDPKVDKKGVIGFQLHSGNTQEIRFRKLELEINPKSMDLKTAK
jgi:hypothetical protein